jgi:four helix bundle protein
MGKGFEDLEVYQQARVLRRRVYKLTKLLPPEEKYVLFSQMRRAAVSTTNCIAEGHGSRSFRHNRSYLYRSRGSVCELQDDFNTCEDEEYFKKEHLDDLREQAKRVLKLINGYIRHLNKRMAEGTIEQETTTD